MGYKRKQQEKRKAWRKRGLKVPRTLDEYGVRTLDQATKADLEKLRRQHGKDAA